ncbi:hypothetical protein SAMN04488564_11560 [Lentzea waywayandensis]|uniref:Uncharacterized protein n=1 Tax=Lentzea waywayandensis TaxID=84724 RepID=A0A1I6FFU0_9PSEU|nr:hypothetical protein SAMN04488564_11560 [Lentzea waywayandensis]
MYHAVTPVYLQHTGPNMYVPAAVHIYAYSASGVIDQKWS